MDAGQQTKDDDAEALLLKAARTFGIHVQRDQVQRAVTEDAAFAEWAVQHLTPDTLVTADELALYMALDKSGEVDRLAALHDLADVPEVKEQQVRATVDELRRATDSITKQTETLRQQRAALDRLVKKDAEDGARRAKLEASQSRKLEAEGKRLRGEVKELSQSLEIRIAELQHHVKDAEPALSDTVNAAFQADDKLLSSLQKLGWELEEQDPEQAKTVERLRDTCMRLIKTTVETVRTKLDTVYLDALGAGPSGDSATLEDVKALEEEVESLYSELLPVAQMSVEQQYLKPALKSVDARSGQSLNRSAVAVEYIDSCMDYLLDRIERLHGSVETFASHQTAATQLTEIARSELTVSTSPARKLNKVALPASPVRRPSPIRPRSNTHRRRSSGIQDDPPLDALLQSLAVSLPVDEDGNEITKVAALAALVDERSRKNRDVANNAQESFENTVMTQMDDARRALQLLQDSVLAESPFAEVMLMDPELETLIEFLTQEVNGSRAKLRVAEDRRPDPNSEAKMAFLKRWG